MGATESIFYDEPTADNATPAQHDSHYYPPLRLSAQNGGSQQRRPKRKSDLPPKLLYGLVVGLPSSGKRSLLERLKGKDPFFDRQSGDQEGEEVPELWAVVPYKAPASAWDRIHLRVQVADTISPASDSRSADFVVVMINPLHGSQRIQAYLAQAISDALQLHVYTNQRKQQPNSSNGNTQHQQSEQSHVQRIHALCLCFLLNFRDLEDQSTTGPWLQESQLKECIMAELQKHKDQLPETQQLLLHFGTTSLLNCFGLGSLHHFIYQSYLRCKCNELEAMLAQVQEQTTKCTEPPRINYYDFIKMLREDSTATHHYTRSSASTVSQKDRKQEASTTQRPSTATDEIRIDQPGKHGGQGQKMDRMQMLPVEAAPEYQPSRKILADVSQTSSVTKRQHGLPPARTKHKMAQALARKAPQPTQAYQSLESFLASDSEDDNDDGALVASKARKTEAAADSDDEDDYFYDETGRRRHIFSSNNMVSSSCSSGEDEDRRRKAQKQKDHATQSSRIGTPRPTPETSGLGSPLDTSGSHSETTSSSKSLPLLDQSTSQRSIPDNGANRSNVPSSTSPKSAPHQESPSHSIMSETDSHHAVESPHDRATDTTMDISAAQQKVVRSKPSADDDDGKDSNTTAVEQQVVRVSQEAQREDSNDAAVATGAPQSPSKVEKVAVKPPFGDQHETQANAIDTSSTPATDAQHLPTEAHSDDESHVAREGNNAPHCDVGKSVNVDQPDRAPRPANDIEPIEKQSLSYDDGEDAALDTGDARESEEEKVSPGGESAHGDETEKRHVVPLRRGPATDDDDSDEDDFFVDETGRSGTLDSSDEDRESRADLTKSPATVPLQVDSAGERGNIDEPPGQRQRTTVHADDKESPPPRPRKLPEGPPAPAPAPAPSGVTGSSSRLSAAAQSAIAAAHKEAELMLKQSFGASPEVEMLPEVGAKQKHVKKAKKDATKEKKREKKEAKEKKKEKKREKKEKSQGV